MYKSPGESRVTKFFSPVKNAVGKVQDAAATVIADSFMGGRKAKRQMRQDDFETKTLKTVNESKGKPDSGDYTDPLFRARVDAKNIQFDKTKK